MSASAKEIEEQRVTLLEKVRSILQLTPQTKAHEHSIIGELINLMDSYKNAPDSRQSTLVTIFNELQTAKAEREEAKVNLKLCEAANTRLKEDQEDLLEEAKDNLKLSQSEKAKFRKEHKDLIEENNYLRRENQRLRVGDRINRNRVEEGERQFRDMVRNMNQDIRILKVNSTKDRRTIRQKTEECDSLVLQLNAAIEDMRILKLNASNDRRVIKEEREEHDAVVEQMKATIEYLKEQFEQAQMAAKQAEYRRRREARNGELTTTIAERSSRSPSDSHSVSTAASNSAFNTALTTEPTRTSERIYRPLEQLAEPTAEEMEKLAIDGGEISGAMALAHRQAALENEKFLARLNGHK